MVLCSPVTPVQARAVKSRKAGEVKVNTGSNAQGFEPHANFISNYCTHRTYAYQRIIGHGSPPLSHRVGLREKGDALLPGESVRAVRWFVAVEPDDDGVGTVFIKIADERGWYPLDMLELIST